MSRRTLFRLQGVTWQLTGGVVKNIIPAIASTNAIIAAACALEALKLLTVCSSGIENYMMCASRGQSTVTIQSDEGQHCMFQPSAHLYLCLCGTLGHA